MKKITLSVGIIITLITSQVAFANNAVKTFSDVFETTHYKESINWMYNNGVIEGYEDGQFRPENCVNRAELLKMMYLVLEEDIIVSDSAAGSHYYDTYFSDTSTDEWYWPYVNHALKGEVIEGYSDGTFKPGQCVNRAEAIKMAILGFEHLKNPIFGGLYKDINEEDWFYEVVYSALERDIVGGKHVVMELGTKNRWFYPTGDMSRKEVAEMLYRMKLIKDSDIGLYTGAGMVMYDLNHYTSPSSGVSFMMTNGWSVTSDVYYETAGGISADYPTITITGPNNEVVVINQRMMECSGEFGATCFELANGYTVGIFDPSTDAMFLMNKILLTFRIPTEERVFDGCGKFGIYSDLAWFDLMEEKFHEEYPDSEDLERFTKEGGFNGALGEGCKAVDDSQFIFIPNMTQEGCGKIFNYDIINENLEMIAEDEFYCANEFGKRVGDYVMFDGNRENGLYSCSNSTGKFNYKNFSIEFTNTTCSAFGEYDPVVFDTWTTYTNQGTGFSIDYPSVWRIVESGTFVGFGPAEVAEDVQWAVNYYDDDNDPGIDALISGMGSQFPTSRTETREEVIFNGTSGTLVTVTTSEYADWISKTVFIEDGGHMWTISNGAIDTPEFVNFYESFELL